MINVQQKIFPDRWCHPVHALGIPTAVKQCPSFQIFPSGGGLDVPGQVLVRPAPHEEARRVVDEAAAQLPHHSGSDCKGFSICTPWASRCGCQSQLTSPEPEEDRFIGFEAFRSPQPFKPSTVPCFIPTPEFTLRESGIEKMSLLPGGREDATCAACQGGDSITYRRAIQIPAKKSLTEYY